MEQAVHNMRHVGTDAQGRDEFICDECGYHFVLSWPPNYHREFLAQAGDPYAMHNASISDNPFALEWGGADVGPIYGDQENDLFDPNAFVDDPYLNPFEEFINKVDFHDPSTAGE